MLRSILAVVTGYVMMMVIVGLATFVLQAIFPAWFLAGTPPPPAYLALSIAYSLVAAFLGGWLAGRIARRKELQHAVGMAVLALAMSLIPALFYGVQTEPRWLQALPSAAMPLTAIAGGWVRARASQARALIQAEG